jgi:dihydropteroate synthase
MLQANASQQLTQNLLLQPRTKIMGILNITPDSFSGDGLIQNEDDYVGFALHRVHKYMASNVDIIDIGGESTRPGAFEIPLTEELNRVIPVIRAIRQQYDVPISIDTTKAEVARAALAVGANIINDVSGLLMDSEMVLVACEFKVPVIIMHSQHAQHLAPYDRINPVANRNQSIIDTVIQDLERLVSHAISQGITRQQIIVDPGIGFGKTVQQNLSLVKNLDRLKKALGYPILLGVSRKSFIGQTIKKPVDQRIPGSIAAMTVGIMKGADIIRVHDVEETVQAALVADAIKVVSA